MALCAGMKVPGSVSVVRSYRSLSTTSLRKETIVVTLLKENSLDISSFHR